MNTSQRWSSNDASEVAALAQSLRFPFSRKEAPNRFLKAAMTERLSSWSATDVRARGVPTQELVNVYRRWGEGGLGHILTGNVMVDYEHLDSPGSAVVAPDAPFSGARFTQFAEIARVAKAHGSLPNPISSSGVQLEENAMGGKCAKPHPATQQEIEDIVTRFTYAAEYMHRAGFDGVELLAAHGYLLAQFLSKSTNKRTDQYGGSLHNRARIVMEIASSIKKRIPSSAGFILGIKINSVEFQAGGFTADEARDLCVLLEQGEFDYVELSGGTWQALAFQHQRESSRKREAFFLEFADLIVPALTKTKVYVTGGFKTLSGMVEALATVDGVGVARPVCQEFDLAQKLLQGRVTGAIRSKVAEDSYGLQNVIAGSQIGQVGKGQEPTDMSNQGNLNAFMLEFEKWQRDLVADTGRMPTLHGYVNLGAPSEESTTTL